MSEKREWAGKLLSEWEEAFRAVQRAQDMVGQMRRRGIWLNDDVAIGPGNRCMSEVGNAVAGWGEVYRTLLSEEAYEREHGGPAK